MRFLAGRAAAGVVSLCLPYAVAWAVEVGGTKGASAVTPAGAASYSIPIAVAPGTNGIEPRLSLEYNSQAGNGPLGLGFSIGGLSTITRCAATLDQDGFIDDVDFDTNDRFCLDGQRLIAISGGYGQSGTEYRTELETFNKVVGYDSTYYPGPYHPAVYHPERCWWEDTIPPTQYCEPAWTQEAYYEPGHWAPAYFKAWTKAGLILEFGATQDSRIEAQGRVEPLTWALNRTSDVFGNYLTVSYLENNSAGEFLLQEVAYAGNTLTGAPANNSLVFSYAPRPDQIEGYLGGAKVSLTQRLTSISVDANGALVRRYNISYDQSGVPSRSRIVSIQECTSNSCLTATTFSWPAAPQWAAFSATSYAITSSLGSSGFTWAADFNGDGRADIASADGGYVHMKLATANGFTSQSWPVSNQWEGAGGNGGYTWVGDFDGNGLADIASANGGNIFMKLSTGSGYTSATWPAANAWGGPEWTWAADFNGDGRTDIASASGSTIYVKFATGSGFTSAAYGVDNLWGGSGYTRVGDFNGDGLMDIASASGGVIYMKLSTGSGFTSETWPVANAWGSSDYTWVGDFNGDGMADFASASGSSVYLKLSTGKGFVSTTWTVGTGWGSSTHSWAADFNGDGLTDIASANGSSLYLHVSRGDGFHSVTQGIPNSWGGPEYIRSADFNGDGLADVASPNNSLLHVYTPSANRLLVSSITDGFGAVATFQHALLTSDQVYTRWTGAAYPTQELRIPMHVVSSYVTGASNQTYFYEGLRASLRGRGLLGFGRIAATNQNTGTKEATEFRQDWPYIGMPSKVTLRTSGGLTLSETETAYDKVTVGVGGSATTFVFAPQIVQRTWEINSYNRPVVSQVTENWFGEPQTRTGFFGSLTRTKVSIYQGRETSGLVPYVTDTVNTFWNDPSRWCLNRLTRAAITRASPTSGPQTRTSAFEFAAVDCSLSAETIEPDDVALWLRTGYERDAYGHITRTTVTGADITARSTTKEFDPAAPYYGRFNTRSCNALNHCEMRTFDISTGNVLSVVGPNGRSTTWQYDSFGRQIRENRPDGTWTTLTRYSCNYCGIANSKFYVETLRSDGAKTQTHMDSLGREVTARKIAVGGAWVQSATRYDGMGRVSAKSNPDFSTSPTYWTNLYYDALGRVIREQAPSNRNSYFYPDGLTTREVDALGRFAWRTVNPLGKVVEVKDALGGTVRYEYDAFDNLTRVTNPIGGVTVMAYDLRGRKISMLDPDMGSWTYGYNALGELISQRDAKGQTVTMVFDVLGRMATRTEPEGVTTWTYDTLWKGALTQVTAPGGYKRAFTYDGFGRSKSVRYTIAGSDYWYSYTYDSKGRPSSITYPAGFWVAYEYDSYGHLRSVGNTSSGSVFDALNCSAIPSLNDKVDGQVDKVCDAVSTSVSNTYWRLDATDAFGNWRIFTYGNGVETMKSHDPATGYLTAIMANAVDVPVQSLNYQWDALGNFKARTDQLQGGLTEAFDYDQLNRLTRSRVTAAGQTALTDMSLTYDAAGRITFKSGVGFYAYGATSHAVGSITGDRPGSFSYDANGSMLSGWGRFYSWRSYNLPWRIQVGNLYSEFEYGPDRERIRQLSRRVAGSKAGLRNITYVGDLYEYHNAGGGNEYKHYIRVGSEVVAIVTDHSSLPRRTRYLHEDHRDSIDAITNENGALVERMSFDAFGKRRELNWLQDPSDLMLKVPHETDRGYTGHEHLDHVGLIHMNGRVYDPTLGRFISADPFVQAPENTQSLNRYSYAMNNPLSMVDPSGYGWKKFWKKWWRPIVAIVVSVITYGYASGWAAGWVASAGLSGTAATVAAGAIAGAISGAVAGGILTGSWNGALGGAAAGAITGGIAGYFGDAYSATRVIADSVGGGVSAELNGESFRQGALIAFTISAITYAAVSAREYELAHSQGTPGQVGDSPGFRGVKGKLGGGRINADEWEKLGLGPLDPASSSYARDLREYYKAADPSYLGGHQGLQGSILSPDNTYLPGGFQDQLVEAYAGVHDFLNHGFFYNANGTAHNFMLGKFVGEVINGANVFLASPVVAVSAVPDSARWIVAQSHCQTQSSGC